MPIHGPDEPVYTIGVMARLVGVSSQMLRVWEKECLLSPARTETNNRLYSENDYYRLVRIRDLTRQGVNAAGIRMVLGITEVPAKQSIERTTDDKERKLTYGQSRRNRFGND
ncbi:MAG: MerR family transcriptional regulator [Sulfobacillus thermosulfidooxidans]|uniref:MerR family transcriptional regulator n=1 Tax=Sulfobacillus thermotolerans TaxID=338644 RepID=A0ABM6RSS3_9FIRM|nr:MerR family transcriptional regulator [Sulfobacillus sp. hq2]AUW94494.1 MerR family transcriptional regulator [Sulfobacillus thermotolerans]MCY0909670.1 MerR family transcriptional regulator [Sulfobacillus thermotolerans]POB09209.1 MerR family DNA-binding transcriptional regulator [Sulfobacillus sp. hq2]PSR36437.1 MAG: MerR family transcriptional regulator [Sulfobacillus thermosulfidooxidans]